MSVPDNVKFFYPHVEIVDQRKRVFRTRVAVAYQIIKDKVITSYSFVSPRDNFTRNDGRNLTLERLKEEKHRMNFSLSKLIRDSDRPFYSADLIPALETLNHRSCPSFPRSWISLRVIDD